MPEPLGPQTCAMCPKMCRFACPVARANATDAVHPTGLGTAVVGADRGTLPWQDAGPVVYQCTMCLRCNTYCALDQDVPAHIRRARADAVDRGVAPAVVSEIGRRGADTGSPHGVDPSRIVAEAIREALQTERAGETDVVYVPSCTAVAREPGIVQAVVAVLQAAGVGVRVVHPGCCGGAFRDLGLTEVADRLEGQMRDAIERARGRRVVTDGPVCARTLEATPFAVLAAEFLAEGRVKPRRVTASVAYHDPCVLGRQLGVYDEPRQVLEAVFGDVTELRHHHEDARCSGGGAGLAATDPEASRAIAAERVAELGDTELLVSACAQCKVQFSGAGVAARDLAEVLVMSL